MSHKYTIAQLVDGEISAYRRFEQMANDPACTNVDPDRLPGAVLDLHEVLSKYRDEQEAGKLSAEDIAAVNKLEAFVNNLTEEISDDMEEETEEDADK